MAMPFVKGQSGNPGGRSTEKRFREALLLELAEDGDARKPLREVAKALIAAALTGDVSAIREIADRIDGKPAQAIDVSGDDRRIIVEIRSFDRPESLDGPPTIDATVNQSITGSVVSTAAAEIAASAITAAPSSADDDLELPTILDRRGSHER
jgi:hypothetical protein